MTRLALGANCGPRERRAAAAGWMGLESSGRPAPIIEASAALPRAAPIERPATPKKRRRAPSRGAWGGGGGGAASGGRAARKGGGEGGGGWCSWGGGGGGGGGIAYSCVVVWYRSKRPLASMVQAASSARSRVGVIGA